MEQFFYELTHNYVLVCAGCSWAIAQVIKFFINFFVTGKADFLRLVGDGGMPSCHSATVTSMACMSLIVYGPGSFEFAVTALIAIIVMHDAMGVRLETGKQAKILNDLMEMFSNFEDLSDGFSNEKLKELVGHTPLQVIAGAFLGFVISLIFADIWF